MATRTTTHTKTFVLLTAWASTIPHDCVDCGGVHVHVGDLCAIARCRQPLLAGQTVYAVCETGDPDAPPAVPCETNPQLTTAECHHAEQWVCWRHIRPDDGPV